MVREGVDPRVTVAVCTRNRASSLAGCIDSLVAQRLSQGTPEILFVDNGSSDGTQQVLQAAVDSGLPLRWISEPVTGHSRARNTAIQEAKAPLLAFTDDDVRLEEGWLEALCTVLDNNPPAVAAGGPVLLEADRALPPWMNPDMVRYLALCDFGSEARVLAYPQDPVGANMIFRTAALREVGGFNTDLGHRGALLIGSDETELFHRIRERGGRVMYAPSARIRHLVPTLRLRRRFMLRRNFAQGLGAGKSAWRDEPAALGLGGAVLQFGYYGKRRLLLDLVRRPHPDTAMTELVRMAYNLGLAAGLTARRIPGRTPR